MLRTLKRVKGCHQRPWLDEPVDQDRYKAFGNETFDSRGRVRVSLHLGHRFANSGGWQYRSRLAVSYALNRILRKDEHVHHEDRVIYHDVLENLTLCAADYHGQYHAYLFTLAGCRGGDGRFTELDPKGSPWSASRFGAIISDRQIDVLHRPVTKTCDEVCHTCYRP